MNSFSPNMLKTYQTCPKKFYYKFIEQINVPTSFLKFEQGKKIHALANYYLQKINISRIETALNEHETELWHSLLNNPFFQKNCYKSEYSLTCKINNYWVGGRLDAVVKDDEKYYILDYKTGSIPKNPEYDYQTMIYLLCLEENLKNNFPISFVYIDVKNTKNYVIEYNEKLKKEYSKRLTNICNEITNDTIYKCNPSNCKFCEYAKLCPKTDD